MSASGADAVAVRDRWQAAAWIVSPYTIAAGACLAIAGLLVTSEQLTLTTTVVVAAFLGGWASAWSP